MEVRLTPAERKAAQQAEAQRLMVGLIGLLSEDQIKDVLAYDGPQDHGDEAFLTRIGPGPDRPAVHRN
jgi:hypothetical protein